MQKVRPQAPIIPFTLFFRIPYVYMYFVLTYDVSRITRHEVKMCSKRFSKRIHLIMNADRSQKLMQK